MFHIWPKVSRNHQIFVILKDFSTCYTLLMLTGKLSVAENASKKSTRDSENFCELKKIKIFKLLY